MHPGSTKCPGFANENVTVMSAFTASPRIEPVSACTPLGISTDITKARELLIKLTADRASSRKIELRPMPKSASTITAQSFKQSERSADDE
jgi:hypothetical protein